jgi:hypothetical protein
MSTKLRILVPIKRVLDYAVKPRIKKDQTGVDLSTSPSFNLLTNVDSWVENVHEPLLRIGSRTIPPSP